MNTTLNKIKAHEPCEEGYRKLLDYLGKTEADNEALPFLTILESNGVDDAIWSLRTCDDECALRLFACDIAESVLHLYEEKYPNDKHPRNAIEVARRFANGEASDNELRAAARAAWSSDTVVSARAAAGYASGSAAWAAVRAAESTVRVAWVARAAEQEKKVELFKKHFA